MEEEELEEVYFYIKLENCHIMELGSSNSNNNNDNTDGNQGDGPRVMNETCEFLSSTDESGYFATLVQDVLLKLGNKVKHLYVTNLYSEPRRDDYYRTQVHIRECLETSKGIKTRSAHNSTAPHATYAASVSDSTKRALWSLCYTHRQELSFTKYHHFPRRTSGAEDTVIPLGEAGEDCLNVLARVTAALNTDLEGATAELDNTRKKLQEAQAKIAQLEAQLAGEDPPEDAEEALYPSMSPPRKRLRYGALGSFTGLLP